MVNADFTFYITWNQRDYIVIVIELTKPACLPHSQAERQDHPATRGVHEPAPGHTHLPKLCVKQCFGSAIHLQTAKMAYKLKEILLVLQLKAQISSFTELRAIVLVQ